MIPDKIYIRDYKGHGLSNTWRKEPYNYNDYYANAIENIEYIRKDALMEWLENKVNLSYGVATDALVEVIDKLNSL